MPVTYEEAEKARQDARDDTIVKKIIEETDSLLKEPNFFHNFCRSIQDPYWEFKYVDETVSVYVQGKVREAYEKAGWRFVGENEYSGGDGDPLKGRFVFRLYRHKESPVPSLPRSNY